MKTITISDDFSCLVDGVNFGQPGDVIVNNPALAADVNIALKNYLTKHKEKTAETLKNAAASVKAADSRVSAAAREVEEANQRAAQHESKLAEVVEAVKNHKGELPTALKQAVKTHTEKRQAALLEQRAKIDAEISAFSKSNS